MPPRAPKPHRRRSPKFYSFVVPPPSDMPDAVEFAAVAEDFSVQIDLLLIAPGQPPIDIEADFNVPPSPEPLEDIETIAARRDPREGKRWRLQWPLSRLQSVITALIVANAIVISWRNDSVRASADRLVYVGRSAGEYMWARSLGILPPPPSSMRACRSW